MTYPMRNNPERMIESDLDAQLPNRLCWWPDRRLRWRIAETPRNALLSETLSIRVHLTFLQVSDSQDLRDTWMYVETANPAIPQAVRAWQSVGGPGHRIRPRLGWQIRVRSHPVASMLIPFGFERGSGVSRRQGFAARPVVA
jgi:hypothetical protein